jgi:ESS family glutamate:Na+ symporter
MGTIAIVLLLSNLLRRNVRFIRNSLMPTAVLGGFVLFIARAFGYKFSGEFLEILVYHGIALGFIAMSLRIPKRGEAGEGGITSAKSGAIIIGSYLIQAIVGLAITISFAYLIMPDMFKAAGILLPMGFGQGPGQANNIGSMYETAGFVRGRNFGLSLAASGYLVACIIGVIAINYLAKKGKVKKYKHEEVSGSVSVDVFQDENEIPTSESVDRFSIQMALVLIVYLATYLLTWGVTSFFSAYMPGVGNTLNTLLWGFNFIIGSALAILTRVIFKKLRKSRIMTRQYQNNYLLNRISGFFFDVMIIAGIAAIDILDLRGLWLPFILMSVAGAVVTLLYLRWVCKGVYKGYYYEGLLGMYGMMTGTISSGVMLIREIDPEFKTPAANQLVTGSSFAIILGIPMLVLISLAIQSDVMVFVTLGLCIVYFVLMLLFIFKVKSRKSRK